MKIAFLTSRVPYPLTSGYAVRAYNVIRHLARDHEVTVYSIGDRDLGDKLSAELNVDVRTFKSSLTVRAWNAAKGIVGPLPLQVHLYENERMMRALRNDVGRGEIDLLFIHLLRMAEYAKAFPEIPAILDAVDSICLNYQRSPFVWSQPFSWMMRLDRGRVCRYEAELHPHFESVLVTSPLDCNAMRVKSGSDRVRIVPNGVDIDRFDPQNVEKHPGRIVFAGKLDYLPNTDAALYLAREIFPRIRSAVPHAQLVIAGLNPPASIRKLQLMEGVSVLANVPDLAFEMAKCGLSIAPLRFGAGIQNKVLEALASELPVICPPHVARPITGSDLPYLKIARDLDGYVKAAVELLRDPVKTVELGKQARRWVKSNFTWESALVPLKEAVTAIEMEAVGKE